MKFFTALFPLMKGTKKLTLTIIEKGGKLTVGFFPEMKNEDVSEKLLPLNLTGTADELDEGFFENVRKQVDTATGLQTNIEQVETELKELEKEKKAEAEKKKSKPAAKKPENKKPESKGKKPAGDKTPAKKESENKKEPATAQDELEF